LRYLFLILICLLSTPMVLPTAAQQIPDCGERPTTLANPRVDFERYCLELVIDAPETGRLGFSALATTPDGGLFATRPFTGELIALTDGDGDGLPETQQVVADGMTLPNGLTTYENALYISGGAHIYRWQDGKLTTLVDDLPAGAGMWTGGIAVGPDERLYVGTGAPCDLCESDDAERGAILSFALDGSDRQLVATGLRQPADLVFVGDTLWVTDTALTSAEGDNLDELNVVTPGADYGWPHCAGAGVALLAGDFDCADSTAPTIALPTHSTPVGLAYYEGQTFPALDGRLLVVLQGSNGEAHMQGYALVAVDPAAPDEPSTLVVPGNTSTGEQFTLQHLNYRTSGIWPRRPLDVTISAEGWVYISVGDGRIMALRPR
jgi:glucose/arabinose dehydrogenase